MTQRIDAVHRLGATELGERPVKIDIVISGSWPSETVGADGQLPPAPFAWFEPTGLGAKAA